MPLSTHARRALSHALKSYAIGDEIADVIDAGSGTLSVAAKERMQTLLTDPVAGTAMCTAIDVGTAITGPHQAKLGIMLCNRVVAQEIATALA